VVQDKALLHIAEVDNAGYKDEPGAERCAHGWRVDPLVERMQREKTHRAAFT
jgi:hypothetical protein